MKASQVPQPVPTAGDISRAYGIDYLEQLIAIDNAHPRHLEVLTRQEQDHAQFIRWMRDTGRLPQ